MEIEPPDTLLGLYQGTPLTERHWGYGNTLPDRVLIFQGPHERSADDEDDLVVAIAETLIHEIGHYFGLSEEEIEEIEEKYWRGEAVE
jgi:predicted Zn-dependent protease with MMP-like domain